MSGLAVTPRCFANAEQKILGIEVASAVNAGRNFDRVTRRGLLQSKLNGRTGPIVIKARRCIGAAVAHETRARLIVVRRTGRSG